MVITLVVTLLGTCCAGEVDASRLAFSQDAAFLEWCSEYCESDSAEYAARIYPAWRENADYLEKQSLLEPSFSMSLNQFAHLSLADFSKRYLRPLDVKRETSSLDFSARTIADPPSSVDWRTKGVVPPVTNQDQCGDVVPFQVTAAVDSFHAIQTGDLELASVEEYIDCCSDGWCEGSLYGKASYACIVRIGGLALESVYVSPEHKCLNNTFPGVIKIDGGDLVSPSGNETALEYAVAKRPVVGAIDASHLSFQLYESGVYYEPDCSDRNLDHLLLIVGYGTTDDGEEYWICENSWGTSWGMQGYVYMARNRGNNCGIATMATYPI